MSTRIHWAGENGHRSCTHGRTATHREVSAAEFLRLSNLCRTCERAAQRAQDNQETVPPGLAAYERTFTKGMRQTMVVAHFGIGKLVTEGQVSTEGDRARFLLQDTKSVGVTVGKRPDADVKRDVMFEWRFETPESLDNVISLLDDLRVKWKAHKLAKRYDEEQPLPPAPEVRK